MGEIESTKDGPEKKPKSYQGKQFSLLNLYETNNSQGIP